MPAFGRWRCRVKPCLSGCLCEEPVAARYAGGRQGSGGIAEVMVTASQDRRRPVKAPGVRSAVTVTPEGGIGRHRFRVEVGSVGIMTVTSEQRRGRVNAAPVAGSVSALCLGCPGVRVS
jgi:hypothetical protein